MVGVRVVESWLSWNRYGLVGSWIGVVRQMQLLTHRHTTLILLDVTQNSTHRCKFKCCSGSKSAPMWFDDQTVD